MGKSNKFDYTNRSNSGSKLGHIIGTALQKEAEKAKKDAGKHLEKARKQSTGSTGGSSDCGGLNPHIIDLKAPSKSLGDDGVCALADGLEIALKSGTDVASLALEDLNLSGNGITTISLARLAPIIELAKYDLKTLNVSGNNIKVESDEEAQQWEAFLRAFKDCLKLRRLDLSSNGELGVRAMEVLARMHVSEEPITPMPPGGEASVLSLISDHSDGNDDRSTRHCEEANEDGAEVGPSMANARLIKRRCGLRSIPYITLHHVGLNDAGALWLSYVVDDHHYPSQLIDELNATNADSLVKTYQQGTHSRGIDWSSNKTLSKEGGQLLDKSEALRSHTMLDDTTRMADSPLVEDHSRMLGAEGQARRRSLERRHSLAPQGDRSSSIRSIRTADGGEHEATELESARKRLQRYVIAHDGAGSVELWTAALTMFRASRIMLYVTPSSRQYYTGEPCFKLPDADVPASTIVPPPSPTDSPVSSSPQLTIDTANATVHSSTDKASYAATLVAGTNGIAGEPELAITEVTNTPTTPLRLQRPTHRKGAFSEGTVLQTVTEKLEVLVVRDASPERFVRHQQRRIAEAASKGQIFRNTNVPSHLTIEVMLRIVRFAMTGREMAVMSEQQRRAAVERGQSRETLTVEREWLKKDESAQVWMLLDSIDCLAYLAYLAYGQ